MLTSWYISYVSALNTGAPPRSGANASQARASSRSMATRIEKDAMFAAERFNPVGQRAQIFLIRSVNRGT